MPLSTSGARPQHAGMLSFCRMDCRVCEVQETISGAFSFYRSIFVLSVALYFHVIPLPYIFYCGICLFGRMEISCYPTTVLYFYVVSNGIAPSCIYFSCSTSSQEPVDYTHFVSQLLLSTALLALQPSVFKTRHLRPSQISSVSFSTRYRHVKFGLSP